MKSYRARGLLGLSAPGSFSHISRRGLIFGSIGATGLLLSGCAAGGGGRNKIDEADTAALAEVDGDLNLFSYADYFSPEVLAGFEEHYDVKINYSYFSSADESIAKLSSGQPIDIITLASERVLPVAQSGLLMKIDHSALSNYGEVLQEFVTPPFNGSDITANKLTAEFVAAPYATGSVGTAWRSDEIAGMSGSFNDFWQQPEAAGRIYLWDSMQSTISMVLKRLGHDTVTAGTKEMDEVVAAIEKLRPSLAGFGGVDTTNIENGQAWITPVYAGDLFMALGELPDSERDVWQFQTNHESALFNADCFAIPAASRSPGTAMCFVDWMLQPENMRINVEYVGYPIPTTTGMEVYNELTEEVPWLRIDTSLFGEPDQWLTPIPEESMRLWQQTWNLVKAG